MNRPTCETCPEIGDYVLATKYEDGDPHDHFCVGFYTGRTWHGRYNVVDSEGKLFRHNGFRRIAKISVRRGKWIVEHRKDIELSGRSVWAWARKTMKPKACIEQGAQE